MKRMPTILLCVLLSLSALLAACAASTPQPTAETPTAEAAVTVVTVPASTAILPSSTPSVAPPASTSAESVSFSQDVMPILQDHCASCHGIEKVSANLDVTSYEALMAGSKNGPVITPGNADDSLFIILIEKGKMPKRGEKLTPEQTRILRDWVNAGAPNN